MRYYKLVDLGRVVAIGTGEGGTEITAEEYAAALEEIRAKASWVSKICAGTASIEDVPDEWREEIQRRAAERLAAMEESDVEDLLWSPL